MIHDGKSNRIKENTRAVQRLREEAKRTAEVHARALAVSDAVGDLKVRIHSAGLDSVAAARIIPAFKKEASALAVVDGASCVAIVDTLIARETGNLPKLSPGQQARDDHARAKLAAGRIDARTASPAQVEARLRQLGIQNPSVNVSMGNGAPFTSTVPRG